MLCTTICNGPSHEVWIDVTEFSIIDVSLEIFREKDDVDDTNAVPVPPFCNRNDLSRGAAFKVKYLVNEICYNLEALGDHMSPHVQQFQKVLVCNLPHCISHLLLREKIGTNKIVDLLYIIPCPPGNGAKATTDAVRDAIQTTFRA
jgi:hypothetical protein